jgi:hypothetical protein
MVIVSGFRGWILMQDCVFEMETSLIIDYMIENFIYFLEFIAKFKISSGFCALQNEFFRIRSTFEDPEQFLILVTNLFAKKNFVNLKTYPGCCCRRSSRGGCRWICARVNSCSCWSGSLWCKIELCHYIFELNEKMYKKFISLNISNCNAIKT